MTIAPFTKTEAIALAARHQGLVGKKYVDENNIERMIIYVIVTPYEQHIWQELSDVFFKMLYTETGYNPDIATIFIDNYAGKDFDVAMVSVKNALDRTAGCLIPIQLLADERELEYGFPITPVS